MIIVGIDPGLSGAIALLAPDGLKRVSDMPTMLRHAGGTVKNQVDPRGLQELLREMVHGHDRNEFMVVIEQQQAMGGGMGASTVFSLGLTAGIIEAVVAAMNLPHELVIPKDWKKAIGLTAKVKDAKGLARTMAQRCYPEAELHLAKHHNRAESILLAKYGQLKYR